MSQTIDITPELVEQHGLTPEEYEGICALLGRTPTWPELGVFGVMYSEHCSYKSSRGELKKLPTSGEQLLVKAGEENAGAVDLGDGWAVVFKIESHNHPSAIEPVQGAATGVGGIVRDIFTMGARPIALMNSLRFGRPDRARSRFLLTGVVKGIADYGNCIGVPTVGGEVVFDDVYAENPLVNVMCVGLVRADALATANAAGPGNPVIYIGSSTGRDGLGGASFASRELDESSQEDRPAVQVGDPFTEKCLIEATLEVLATGHVVAIQDMGAAGLTCSTCETASRGGMGIDIDVSHVPRRESGMTPYEVLLSESQERMLLVVERGHEDAIMAICAKWGLSATVIGTVTDDGLMRVREDGRIVVEVPAKALADDVPLAHRPSQRPQYLDSVQAWTPDGLDDVHDVGAVLAKLLADPSLASKRWVWQQYDHMVQTNTVVLPGAGDAAVLRLKERPGYLAVSTDGNGRYTYLGPRQGGALAVAEAARNVACVGATPLAVTNCLNFANPQDPEIYWQFVECVAGITEACRALDTPVTGGNVSFYNESPEGPIDPTPIIGMVGVIRQDQEPVSAAFRAEGDSIVLLGETAADLGGTAYLSVMHGLKMGMPPRLNLERERAVQRVLIQAAEKGLLSSAHDCSDGGLAVALAECCILNEQQMFGAQIHGEILNDASLRLDELLFGESPSRIVVSCNSSVCAGLQRLADEAVVPCRVIGEVGGDMLKIAPWVEVPTSVLAAAYHQSLPQYLDT